jgi:hypothetical protein
MLLLIFAFYKLVSCVNFIVYRFDIIFNTEGSVAHEPCLKFCKPGGLVITTETSKIESDTYGFFFGAVYAFWIRIRCLIQVNMFRIIFILYNTIIIILGIFT